MMRKPMIIAERDLAGATPESLARALLSPLRPRHRTEPVLGDEVAVEKPSSDKPSNGVEHLVESS